MSQPTNQHDNFLITGFGRSGTMFLASALNHSPAWTVLHEPSGDRASLTQAIARFQRNHYGEVNSWLRDWLPSIPAHRKAIILRNPRELAVSVYNRHPVATPERLHGVWELLDGYVEQEYEVFRFEEFTQSVESVYRIAQWAGIEDLELPCDIVDCPLNATQKKMAHTYAEIPNHVRDTIDAGVEWFRRKYY